MEASVAYRDSLLETACRVARRGEAACILGDVGSCEPNALPSGGPPGLVPGTNEEYAGFAVRYPDDDWDRGSTKYDSALARPGRATVPSPSRFDPVLLRFGDTLLARDSKSSLSARGAAFDLPALFAFPVDDFFFLLEVLAGVSIQTCKQ